MEGSDYFSRSWWSCNSWSWMSDWLGVSESNMFVRQACLWEHKIQKDKKDIRTVVLIGGKKVVKNVEDWGLIIFSEISWREAYILGCFINTILMIFQPESIHIGGVCVCVCVCVMLCVTFYWSRRGWWLLASMALPACCSQPSFRCDYRLKLMFTRWNDGPFWGAHQPVTSEGG